MCLALIALGVRPDLPLVIAANRDEFHDRASEPAHRWATPQGLLAGRDAVAGGTWLGVTAAGRAGLITNFHDPGGHRADALSRGRLLLDYLAGSAAPAAFGAALADRSADYNGFNLLFGEGDAWYCVANRGSTRLRRLEHGIHGLGNRLLNEPVPKLDAARSRFAALIHEPRAELEPALFALLGERAPHGADARTPEHPWRDALSAIFVQAPGYGTRCSTLLLVDDRQRATFIERRFDAAGRFAGSSRECWTLGCSH
jgi:uncharacterized protein with NRDE domain